MSAGGQILANIFEESCKQYPDSRQCTMLDSYGNLAIAVIGVLFAIYLVALLVGLYRQRNRQAYLELARLFSLKAFKIWAIDEKNVWLTIFGSFVSGIFAWETFSILYLFPLVYYVYFAYKTYAGNRDKTKNMVRMLTNNPKIEKST